MQALFQAGNSYLFAHEFEKAVEYAEQAKALAIERHSTPMLAASKQLLGVVCLVTGKSTEATTFIEDSLRLSREADVKILETWNLLWLGLSKSWQGDFGSAQEIQEEVLARAKAENVLSVLLWIVWHQGLRLGGQGQYDNALTSLAEALEWSSGSGIKS